VKVAATVFTVSIAVKMAQYLIEAEIMDIKANSLYQEMQAMVGETRLPIERSAQTLDVNPSGTDFASMLKQAVDGVNAMQQTSKNMQERYDMGDTSLSLAQVMIAKEKAGIAFEATLQVRNKVLEAYKQIMNMPV